ncbi:hypothetical protein HDE68_005305 [Pedobacter cryoconitis]|uniref:Uncharacterized protein n=1 Tax=Pedobacter cryoconitis TaxID=188932 RepID=A0A7W8ZSP5_9SPHI|nr:hypothetical protein [Pedobacter cryoconitis]
MLIAYIGGKAFIMESLTGKFSKGILGDFIFKAAVWSTGCFKNSVPGTMKQSMETEKNIRELS